MRFIALTTLMLGCGGPSSPSQTEPIKKPVVEPDFDVTYAEMTSQQPHVARTQLAERFIHSDDPKALSERMISKKFCGDKDRFVHGQSYQPSPYSKADGENCGLGPLQFTMEAYDADTLALYYEWELKAPYSQDSVLSRMGSVYWVEVDETTGEAQLLIRNFQCTGELLENSGKKYVCHFSSARAANDISLANRLINREAVSELWDANLFLPMDVESAQTYMGQLEKFDPEP